MHQIKAYFIGGPEDLSVRMLDPKLDSWEVALLDRPVRNYKIAVEQNQMPRMRIGRYRKVGRAAFHQNTYFFEWEGEV